MNNDFTAGGDVNITAEPGATLKVNGMITSGIQDIGFNVAANGSTDTNKINYADSITASTISIEPIQSQGGHFNFTGTLTGSGTIRVLDGFSKISITNDSSKHLLLNNLNLDNRANGSIRVNGNSQTLPGRFGSLTLSTYGHLTGTIPIQNNSNSNVQLGGPLRNQSGLIQITNAFGNIERISGTQLLASKAVLLTANNGFIGTSQPDIKTDLQGSRLDASASGNIDLTEVCGDMQVGTISSSAGNVTLTADGSILDEDNDAASDVNAANITLTAQTGKIGRSNHALEINTSGSGTLTASAQSDIFLTEVAGPLNVSQVSSNTGNVNLTAAAGDLNLGTVNSLAGTATRTASGSILDATNTPASNINAVNINLTAQTGTIGASTNALDMDSSNATTGKVNASAQGDINLTEVTGDLRVGQVTSATGNVNLTAPSGSIVDVSNTIRGVNSNLLAPNGSIGSSSNLVNLGHPYRHRQFAAL